MTTEERAELRALRATGTGGEWVIRVTHSRWGGETVFVKPAGATTGAIFHEGRRADSELAAAAVNSLIPLLDRVEALEAALLYAAEEAGCIDPDYTGIGARLRELGLDGEDGR